MIFDRRFIPSTSQMENIIRADVKLAIPQEGDAESILNDKPRATIKLTLNKPLHSEELTNIIHFIAYSVSGVDQEYITVIDSDANILYISQHKE